MIEITYIDPIEGLKTVPASEVPDWVLYDGAEERRKASKEALKSFNRHLDEMEDKYEKDLQYYLSL